MSRKSNPASPSLLSRVLLILILCSTSQAIPAAEPSDTTIPESTIIAARDLRESLLADRFRPQWHFAIPEDEAMPGDPNGCFYANGRYHLMYLYNRRASGFCWGHLSSSDLIHWKNHPDAIVPGNGDTGAFSGGAFLNDDGTAWLSYWMLDGPRGIGLVKSIDKKFNHWEKVPENPIIKSTEFGITEYRDDQGNQVLYGSADPSNIWKKNGKYYMCCGSLPVLNKYGRGADSPEDQRGDRLYLFESQDLLKWDYKGIFYQRNPEWTEDSEDNMCPSFLPLSRSKEGGPASDKYLLLFISHNKGCQYYIGTYDENHDRFLPESHGRMTRVDNAFFAPEALIDGQGRPIMWAWLMDDNVGDVSHGWRGVYGLPRILWLGDDNTLRLAPPVEYESLRYQPGEQKEIAVGDHPVALENVTGNSCELELTISKSDATRFGVRVLSSPDGQDYAAIYYDAEKKMLCMDTTHGCQGGRPAVEELPFEWKEGEPLVLRVFVDRVVIDCFANDRQAVTRRYYPANEENQGVALFSEGGATTFQSVRSWEIMPANPY